MLVLAIIIIAFFLVVGLFFWISRAMRKPVNKVYQQKGKVILDEVEESSWHPKYDLN